MNLLTVKNLEVQETEKGIPLVRGIDFSLKPNTCLGILGESGSGKTLACTAMLGLAGPGLSIQGEVWFNQTNLLMASGKTLRQIRGNHICMILQNPMTAFNPLYTLGRQMGEVLVQKRGFNREQASKKLIHSLVEMQIRDPKTVMAKYPHQLSGGMLQRCMIALTLALEPELIIADEPTTALDSINRQEVINLFIRLRELTRTSLIFISHDLGVIRHLAGEILVIQKGCQVELGPARRIFKTPAHPYTRYLIQTHDALKQSFNKALTPESAHVVH